MTDKAGYVRLNSKDELYEDKRIVNYTVAHNVLKKAVLVNINSFAIQGHLNRFYDQYHYPTGLIIFNIERKLHKLAFHIANSMFLAILFVSLHSISGSM